MTVASSPFQALVFDLGGVIVPHDNEVLHQRLVAGCSAADASDRLRKIAHAERFGTGESSIADLHQLLVRELGYRGDWPAFVQDWNCHLGLDTDMLAYVEQLAGVNRVMIFSNTNQEHWDHAVAMSGGALGRYEAFLSHEIGQLKPSIRSFQTVAEMAGIEPGRSLFIDDRADNVDGARRAGFQAAVFTTQADLAALLESAGVPMSTTA
jgi:putative hydrolase of the HAD superfamily